MAVINAKVKWASIQAPNDKFTPQWCIDVVLDEAKAKELHAQGFNVKKDKDGDIVLKMKKNVARKDGTRNAPPKVVGPDKQPFLELVGNGSVCNVQYNPFEWEYAGKKGVTAQLVAVQVVEHVPFNGGGDEFDVVDSGPSDSDVGGSDDSFSGGTDAPSPEVKKEDEDLPF